MDNKIDGKFIIQRGGITHGIAEEMGLSKNELKKIDGSIWNQVISQLKGNISASNNNGINPDEANKYTVNKNAVIEIEKDSWKNIVGLISKAIGRDIKIDSGQPANIPVLNGSKEDSGNPKAQLHTTPAQPTNTDLENWYLDDSDIQPGPTAKEWYQQYVAEHGKMNFPTALQYLKNNPENKYVSDYIKTAFGICDGDISENEQGGIGTCHLLSSYDAVKSDPDLANITDNIIKQNDDGTVTVTFFGAFDEKGEPIKYTITNQDISKSYRSKSNTSGGSSDPDAAALEIAYQRLLSFASEIKNKKEEEMKPLDKQEALEKMRLRMVHCAKHKDESTEYAQLYNYLAQNADAFNKLPTEKDINKKIEADGMMDLYIKCYIGSSQRLEEIEQQIDSINEKYKPLLYHNLESLDEETITDGSSGVISMRLLTGKKTKSILSNTGIDEILSDSNVHKPPMTIDFKEDNPRLHILKRHAYSFKEIYIDSKTGEKMVKIKNPHGSIITLKYSDFIENVETLDYIEK